MSTDSWIVVADHAAIGKLIEVARGLEGTVTALVVGSQESATAVASGGVDRVVWIETGDGVPVEAYAGAVGRIVAAQPAVVLAGRDSADRALLGAAAAALRVPVLTGVTQVVAQADGVHVTHGTYGGISQEELSVPGAVALLLDGGATPAASAAVSIEQVTETPAAVVVAEVRRSEHEQINLGAADRVVSVGRGLKDRADLGIIEALASAADAEVGCSRPLAEGLEWFGKERYIGISGQHISPELYLAIGISGQLQHIAGARGAKVIVSINNDAKAPIVAESDFAVIGDLYELVPAITAALA